jgi:hypothetical protein
MKELDLSLIASGGDSYRKFKRRIFPYAMLGVVESILIVLLAGVIIWEHFPVDLPTTLNWRNLLISTDKTVEWLPEGSLLSGMNSKEIKRLAEMIRVVTDKGLPEWKAYRYAGLIYYSAQKYDLNPLEIIALITAESSFKAGVVNKRAGDYGLGQINYEHWGKPLGLTTQDLLDPSINIVMTCHVFKFFGGDFGKYHRGKGIRSKAYAANIKSILSTLAALAKANHEDMS